MNELLWLVMLVVSFGAILAGYRLFGKTGLYIWVPVSVIIANLQVVKTVELLGMTATLGNIVYATSFLVTDILSENYGAKEARKAVYIGFFALIAMTFFINFALLFEPAEEDFAHESMTTLFGLIPRIAGASLTAYWLSQLHDVWAYQFWKMRIPSKRHIWIRNNASTIISQMLDSLIFTIIAFAGVFEVPVLIEITATTYLLKLVVAVADTPFVYIARSWRDRKILPEQKYTKTPDDG
ncbi:MAG: hypothetical protein CMN78_05805 [Spirochaetales bacterium]|nr:hypothetical protein [Spirochaetales bacterium]